MTAILLLAILGNALGGAQAEPGATRPGIQNVPMALPPAPGVDLSRPLGQSLVPQPPPPPPGAGDDSQVDAELPQPRKDPAPPFGGPGGLHHGALSLPITPESKFSPESGRFIQQIRGPENLIEVIVGRLQIFKLERTPLRIQVGDDSVANYAMISATELSLQGLKVGNTQLNLWFPDPAAGGKNKLLTFLVRILPDPEGKYRLERAYKNLEKEINCQFPDSKICLVLVGDKLAVTGQAKDIAEANFIIRLVQANVLPEIDDSPDLAQASASDPPTRNRQIRTGGRQVLNLLRVPGEQQVMLQVTVAEVDRAAARSVGCNFGLFRTNGGFLGGSTIGNVAFGGNGFGTGLGGAGIGVGGAGGFGGVNFTGLGGGIANVPLALDNGQLQSAIVALRNMAYARFLAEPNLVAINGQTATFQVGAMFPIPVVGGFASTGLQGVNYIPIGVQLFFTPFITDRDRIRLSLSANVSDRDQQVAATMIDGAAIPSLVTRNFQTTVELREGQTLAIAGLVQSKLDGNALRVPWIGAVPVLGRFFSFDHINAREQELVVLVTPRLVHPMDHKQIPPLPGHDLFEPNDCEFYLLGRMESHMGVDFRSPIRTDCSRFKQYRRMEMMHLAGPHGPTLDMGPDQDGGPDGGPAPGVPGAGPVPPGMTLPPGSESASPYGSGTVPPGAEMLPVPKSSTPLPNDSRPGGVPMPLPQ